MALWVLAAPGAGRWAAAGDQRTGEQIFRRQCAACHGIVGEGTPDEFPEPLTGDKNVPELTAYIAKNMPADEPGTCTGADAVKVAAYIHEAFYSKEARARNRPPRIEVSRLTVRQYRNAVADLIGRFRAPGKSDKERGLRAEYFKSRKFRTGDRVIDRRDPEVKFEFGESSPDPAKLSPYLFSIRWTGSVYAPETGEYEFVIRSEHGTQLWVNDRARPLIDALVRSKADTESRATIFLLGGRFYPLKLDFIKIVGQEDDSKEEIAKRPSVKASVALLWKPPQGALEVVPRRNLSPNEAPETFVAATPFPVDDRNVGSERGRSVSKDWDQAVTAAAFEVAGYIHDHQRELTSSSGGSSDHAQRLSEFCVRFAENAFHRPLTDPQKQLYVDSRFAEAGSPELAVKRVVLLVLKSPLFLYRYLENGRPDHYEVASRLSFGLWDSLPDRALAQAAASGRCSSRAQVTQEAQRMVDDPRARAKLRDFFLQWLKVDSVPDLAKDPALVPGFTPAVAADLRKSLDLFLDDVIWSGTSDFRQVLLANDLYLNGRLARFYGAGLCADAPFQKVVLDDGARAGILSHPYLMAAFAYPDSSSPIHRGVFIARSVLGRALRPPPEAQVPLSPALHPGLTTRQRVALQTSPAACTTCHGMINSLGFALENFDAAGRYRKTEHGRAIDATGTYESPSGTITALTGARELATRLAASPETHAAFVEQLFSYLVKQPIRAFGPGALPELVRSFAASSFHIRKLIVEIMATSAPTARAGKSPGKEN
jgi:hypothetical protein